MATTQEAQRAGEARRSAILDAALSLFATRGYRGTSIAAVAEAVGISQPGVLHHFSNKDQLFETVLAERDRRAFAAVEVDREYDGPPLARALEVIDDMAAWDLDNRELVQLGHVANNGAASAPDLLVDGMRERTAQYRENLAGVVRDSVARGETRADADPERVASLILAGLTGCESQWLVDESFDLVAAVREFTGILRRDLFVDSD